MPHKLMNRAGFMELEADITGSIMEGFGGFVCPDGRSCCRGTWLACDETRLKDGVGVRTVIIIVILGAFASGGGYGYQHWFTAPANPDVFRSGRRLIWCGAALVAPPGLPKSRWGLQTADLRRDATGLQWVLQSGSNGDARA